MLELYKKALKDYMYFDVCKKYCDFVLRLYQIGKADATLVREAYEKVLTIYGIDLGRSSEFW